VNGRIEYAVAAAERQGDITGRVVRRVWNVTKTTSWFRRRSLSATALMSCPWKRPAGREGAVATTQPERGSCRCLRRRPVNESVFVEIAVLTVPPPSPRA